MEIPFSETAWRRANKDTISAFHTLRFWIFDVLAIAIFTLIVLFWTPSWVSNEWKIIYQVLVPVFIAVIGLVALYLVSLVKAPYKQRNEIRALLMKKPQPRPLQDRDKIIRLLFDIEKLALELIGHKRRLAELCEHNPNDINRQKQLFQIIQKCEAEYATTVKAVEREIRVAGEDYAPAINSLLNVMNLGIAFWNSTTSSGQDYLHAYKYLLEHYAKEIRDKVDEINQQVLDKTGFQT
ncbi:MAG: hypothetical protein ABR958_09155 [Dehalococcoidales bacterium]